MRQREEVAQQLLCQEGQSKRANSLKALGIKIVPGLACVFEQSRRRSQRVQTFENEG